MDSHPPESEVDRNIQTGGGAYVGDSVNTGGGDFVGRDKITIEQATIYITQVRRADQPKGWDGRDPYIGLSSFRENQANIFFGREKLVSHLLDKLKATRFLCVSGPSGGGKSSLVQAGIIPALRTNGIAGSSTWLIETLTPGNQPLEHLASAMGRLAKSPDAVAYMRSHTDDPATLHAQVETLLSYQPDQRAVIVVDQFEEIFTQTKDETTRQPFLNLLTHAIQKEDGRVIVLLIMRSDFVSQCATYPELRKLLSGHIELVGAMEAEELARAIALPALEVGVEVKPDLVVQVINDMAGEPGALPLMEFALKDLFDAHPKQKGQFVELTRQEYLLRGGIQQALERHAEAAFNQLSTTQQEIARTIFMSLIEVGRGTVDTRRTATFAELVPSGVDASQVETIEQILAGARLITTEDQQVPQISEAAQLPNPQLSTRTVTLAHEALINAWPWLKQLVKENRNAIELQNQIGEDAAAWTEGHRDASYLYAGARLQTAQEQLAAKQITLSELAAAFIAAGVQEQRRRTRNGYLLASAIGGLIFAILGAIIFGQSQLATQRQKAAETLQAEVFVQQTAETKAQNEANLRATEIVSRTAAQATAEANLVVAQTQARRAKASELAAASQREVAQPVYDPSLALLLAMQAITMTHPADGQVFINATIALDNAVRNAPPWQLTLQGHRGAVHSAAFSADGQRIVTASSDETAKVWDAVTGKELFTLQTGYGSSAAFSADGQRIVTAGADEIAKVWDAVTGKELFALQGHKGAVNSAVFSADGQRVVTASDDESAKVWDATSGKELFALQGFTVPVTSAVFSVDGRHIVTGSWDKRAKVWDAISGKELLALQGHRASVRSAAFSADGQRIVTASWDLTAKVWDVTSGKELLTLQGHRGAVHSAAFSADGQRIVTASADGTAKVWDAVTGKSLLTLQGHRGTVDSAVFSADGQRIVTASWDKSAKVWDATSGKPLLILQGHSDVVHSAAFSADGQRIVTASYNGTAVWDAVSGKPLLTLPGLTGAVNSAAFSADGQRIVTTDAGYDLTAKVWDAVSGKLLLTLQGHTGAAYSVTISADGQPLVTASADRTAKEHLTPQGHTGTILSAAFSADRQRIVTASWDNTAKVWDAANGKPLLTLQGHRGAVNSAAFSADGQRIVTASADGTTKVWDAVNGKELLTLQGLTGVVNSAVFSADGQRIITASHDRSAKVWDAVTGKSLLTLPGLTGVVHSAAFSADGQRIVTASADGIAKVWDAVSGKPLLTLQGLTGAVRSAAFSADGQRIVTGSADRTARTWFSSVEAYLAGARRLVQRDPPLFTVAERQRYGLDDIPALLGTPVAPSPLVAKP